MLQLGAWPCEINVEAHDARRLTTINDDLRNVVGEDIGVVDVTLYDRDEFTWGFGDHRNKRELETATANAA